MVRHPESVPALSLSTMYAKDLGETMGSCACAHQSGGDVHRTRVTVVRHPERGRVESGGGTELVLFVCVCVVVFFFFTCFGAMR